VEPTDPPGHRRFRLTTVRGCRAELASVYGDARNAVGNIDWQDAARAASVLHIITRMLEGSEIEARLARLEAALAERDGRPRPRPNGSARYAARVS
jgi:hypothetical protein